MSMILDTPTVPSRNITISSFAHRNTTMASIVKCKTFSITTRILLIKVLITAIILKCLTLKNINNQIDNKNAHNAHNIIHRIHLIQSFFKKPINLISKYDFAVCSEINPKS